AGRGRGRQQSPLRCSPEFTWNSGLFPLTSTPRSHSIEFAHHSRGHRSHMAKAKKSAKKPARKAAKKAAPKTAAKSVKSVLSKSALVHHLAGTSGAAAKDVRAVIAALEDTIRASISKKGPRTFVLPGLLK